MGSSAVKDEKGTLQIPSQSESNGPQPPCYDTVNLHAVPDRKANRRDVD